MDADRLHIEEAGSDKAIDHDFSGTAATIGRRPLNIDGSVYGNGVDENGWKTVGV